MTADLIPLIADYLPRCRWFGGKSRTFHVTDVHRVGELVGQGPQPVTAVVLLAHVRYPESEERELYQIPLALYDEHQNRLEHAHVGEWQGRQAYDALHDREAMALWLEAFDRAAHDPSPADGSASDSALAFHRLPGHDLDLEAHSTLYSGEQSNSSVAFGEDSLMKVFRKITPGLNPDVQIHRVLTEADVDHIAPLYGWLDAVVDIAADTPHDPDDARASETTVQLAMLQRFFRTATDGWVLAQSSVRTLFAQPEVHAAVSGGDFAGEATRLGEALAHVHRVLREHFPVATRPAVDLAATMARRLDGALAAAPDLAPYAGALRELYAEVAGLGDYPVQVVHGDLHLGQTLRTSMGWKLVDFEGEPERPLAERMEPDSAWRDVAGMLRSFDYAARAYLHEQEPQEHLESAQTRADEWVNRCRNHFVVSYAATLSEGGADASTGALKPQDRALLDAYVADKAVYEVLYETRNRPTWIDIPLHAVARLVETP